MWPFRPVVRVGDQMLVSFEFVAYQEAVDNTFTATVTGVKKNPDGTKTIFFQAPIEAKAYSIARRLVSAWELP